MTHPSKRTARAGRIHVSSHLLGALVSVTVFAGALWLLHHELEHYKLSDVRESLSQLTAFQLVSAAGLTCLSYVILMGYDFLALRYVRHPLAPWQVAVTSFVSYASSNNFGALLGGSTVRYRFYAGFGLSTVEIVKILAMLGLTFTTGFFTLAGVSFLIHPLPLPPKLHLDWVSLRPLGGILLGVMTAYLIATAVRRTPITFRGWSLELPSTPLALGQIAVAAADFATAAGVLYMLLPAGVEVSYLHFVAIFLVAIVATVLSHVPGGLGVLELTILWLLNPPEPDAVLASLLAFRAIYYLAPLGVAAALFAGHEAFRQRETLAPVIAGAGQWAPAVVPRLFALLMLVSGAVLLFSGATPAEHGRMAWLGKFVPLPVVELSHFLASLAGAGLLVLGHGIYRRIDTAYYLSLGLLAAGSAFCLLKGADYEEAALLAGMFLALLPMRRHFYRHGGLLRDPISPVWSAATLVVVGASVWLGFFAFKHQEYQDNLWWQFAFHGDAPRFLRASVGVAGLLVLVGVVRLLRPRSAPAALPTADDLARAEPIITRSPRPAVQLARLGDKRLLFHEVGDAFLMYAVQGRTWVALGDPVGPPERAAELVWRFRELCDRFAGRPAFYQVGVDLLPVYLEQGFSLQKLGEEGRVSLADFTLEGAAHRTLRSIHNHFQKSDCTFEVSPAEQTAALLPELKAISDAWLETKRTREKGFSLGFFEEKYLARCPLALVRRQGRIVAFANVLEGAEKFELSIDLMRHVDDAPNGIMDSLFVELMLWGHAQGFRWFSMGMAPLAGLEAGPLSPVWNRLADVLYRHGEHFYNFQGLRQYKEKFHPEWSPRYLASQGGLALPQTLGDIATLIAGGVGGLVGR